MKASTDFHFAIVVDNGSVDCGIVVSHKHILQCYLDQ